MIYWTKEQFYANLHNPAFVLREEHGKWALQRSVAGELQFLPITFILKGGTTDPNQWACVCQHASEAEHKGQDKGENDAR